MNTADTKHTQEPWVNHGLSIATPDAWKDGNGEHTAIALVEWSGEDTEEREKTVNMSTRRLPGYGEAQANALLIASAPELLEALRATRQALEDLENEVGEQWEQMGKPLYTSPRAPMATYKQARVAIAKATGGTP